MNKTLEIINETTGDRTIMPFSPYEYSIKITNNVLDGFYITIVFSKINKILLSYTSTSAALTIYDGIKDFLVSENTWLTIYINKKD